MRTGLIVTRPTISIGIPSYRRHRAFAATLHSIFTSAPRGLHIEVLAVNDSGGDSDIVAYRKVVAESLHPERVRLVEHSKNLGYPRSIITLFEEAESDYLLVSSDDDLFKLHHIEALLNFLSEKNPDICSAQFLRSGLVYRGQEETRKAMPAEFYKLNQHAPGVVYRVAAIRPILHKLLRLLDNKNSFAETYPQLVFSIDLLMGDGNCWFYADSFVEEGARLSSGIKDSSGEVYWSLQSRIQQLADQDKFLLRYEESELRSEIISVARRNGFKKCFRAERELFEGAPFKKNNPKLLQALKRFKKWAKIDA
jgi:glycosyltransferase involved in cell wall biosynthesis